ncbi:hypothetical protein [Yersinia phage fHe-Yen9-04]|nr:virion structural protein [Yersinia phage fHe-Yen9-04]SOK58368.1 hypothetical protein [Yersinia phage fHe-Yen9-04]VUE36137.1 hypothetical protein [Yersinia phage fHe-Yen9-04]
MIYKELTQNQTNIWIKNINKSIELNEFLLEKIRNRYNFMNDEYNEKYLTGWTRFFFEKTCYASPYNGYIYEYGHGIFKLRNMTPFTNEELLLDYHSTLYFEKWKRKLALTQERWLKYADQPFKIDENDVIFYQELIEFHYKSIVIIKNLGIDNEKFNLDEDC